MCNLSRQIPRKSQKTGRLLVSSNVKVGNKTHMPGNDLIIILSWFISLLTHIQYMLSSHHMAEKHGYVQ